MMPFTMTWLLHIESTNITGVLGYTSVVYDAVKAVVPTVKDVYLPYSGRHDLSAYISIEQTGTR